MELPHNISIMSLKDLPDYRQTLTDYVRNNWTGVYNAFTDVLAEIYLGKKVLPDCYMMLKDKRIIGFYQLVEQELLMRKDLSPWITCVFIDEQEKETYAMGIRELTREKSLLTAEIKELEKKKGTLLGEMNKDITDTLQQFKSAGESAVIEIQQQVNDIQHQFDSLLVDALKSGQTIGVMRQMANKGKEAEKSLEDFVKDLQTRTGVRND